MRYAVEVFLPQYRAVKKYFYLEICRPLEAAGSASTNIRRHVHWGSSPPDATYPQNFYRSLINMAAYSKQMSVATKTEDHTVYNPLVDF
jgi:hypothetical protein